MLMPSEWGEFILGETWPVVEPLIVPFTIGILAIGLDTPTYIGLRALEAAGTAFRTRLVVAAADVTSTIAGAAFGGAVGAAWAGKTAQLLGTGLWWRAYWTRLAEREAWPAQLAESPSK
jgi:O-antigen/teichoic acid export membrane protein